VNERARLSGALMVAGAAAVRATYLVMHAFLAALSVHGKQWEFAAWYLAAGVIGLFPRKAWERIVGVNYWACLVLVAILSLLAVGTLDIGGWAK